MSDLQECLKHARQAYESADFPLCHRFLDRAAAIDPESLGLMRWRARLAHREGDWQMLHDMAALYCDVDPDDREMRQFLARACSNMKRWPDAARAWRHVIALRPEWPEALFQLARSQVRSNLSSAANATVAELETLGERDIVAWQLCGRLAVETGDIACAVRLFSRLAERDSARAEDELRLFETSKDRHGALAAAVAMRARAPSQDWDEKIAAMIGDLTMSAAIHQRDGDLVEAYRDFAAIAAAASDDPLAAAGMDRIMLTLQNQAKRHVAQEDPHRAIETYQTILRCAPGNERALIAIGRLLMALQEWSAAADAWSAVLDRSPGDRDAWVQYARAAERAQCFAQAHAAWSRVLVQTPDDCEAQDAIAKLPARIVRAGRRAVEEKNYIDAARLFASVTEDCPEYADARRRLDQVARYLVRDMRASYKEKRFARVVSLGTAAARIAPASVDVHRLLAQAAMTGRDYAVAAQAWRRLMELSPEFAPAYAVQLARCHLRTGKLDEGRAILSDVLLHDPENDGANTLAPQFGIPDAALAGGGARIAGHIPRET